MATPPLVVLVCFALAAAGCASTQSTADADNRSGSTSRPVEGTPGAPDPSDAPPSDVDPAQLVDAGTRCEQLHAIFASPSAGVDWGLPPGWSTTSFDGAGATDSVYVYPTRCAEGSHAWVLVGVEPPAALQDAEVDLEYWVVQLVESDPALAAALSAAGFPVAQGTADLDQQGNAELWAVESDAGARYTLTSVVGEPTGDDFLVVQRFWTMGAEAPLALRVEIATAEDRGMGAVGFTAEGDANAPPVLPGIAHRIGAMSYTASWDDAGSTAAAGDAAGVAAGAGGDAEAAG